MGSNILSVQFDFDPSILGLPAFADVDPEILMRSLISYGFEYFVLTGIPGRYSALIESNSQDMHFLIDDDVKEFTSSYRELEEIAKYDDHWKHYVFLRDGVLQITAACRKNQVDMLVERCPGLNKIYLSQHVMNLTSSAYLATWRNAIRILSSYTHVSGSTDD